MYSESDLEAAVAGGALTPQQAASFRDYVSARRHTPVVALLTLWVNRRTVPRRAQAGPVETAILDQCGHSPQIDRPDATLEAISEFVHRVLALHEGLKPAA